MKKKFMLSLLAALLLLGAGAILGRMSKRDMVISSTTAGASYSGGFQGVGATAGAIRTVAGPTPTRILVVKNGDSIQAAVKSAAKGTVEGLGWRSYTAALRALVEILREAKKS